jgi:hypothetical protein
MTELYANLAVLAINVGVLGLTLKLYTEILKDSAMNRRTLTRPLRPNEPAISSHQRSQGE